MSWPNKYESGVTLYDKSRSYPGYNLITPFPGRAAVEPNQIIGEVYLMDMNGKSVHSWKTPYPAWWARLTPEGTLVANLRCAKPAPDRPGYDHYHMGAHRASLWSWTGIATSCLSISIQTCITTFRNFPTGTTSMWDGRRFRLT